MSVSEQHIEEHKKQYVANYIFPIMQIYFNKNDFSSQKDEVEVILSTTKNSEHI